MPGVQVASVERAAADPRPAARLPPLRTLLETASRDTDHVSKVQVAALADAEAAGVAGEGDWPTRILNEASR